jgi:RNA recognition motif-containing protein
MFWPLLDLVGRLGMALKYRCRQGFSRPFFYRATSLGPPVLILRSEISLTPRRIWDDAAPQRVHMSNKLYVGNLSFDTTENELQDLFASAGAVQEVILIQDRITGRSKGFGFVTMSNAEDAKKAISQINGKNIGGRALTVNEARPKEDRPSGGGGGGGGGRRDFGGPPRGRDRR